LRYQRFLADHQFQTCATDVTAGADLRRNQQNPRPVGS